MRGEDRQSGELFAYVGIEVRLSLDHPLRTIKVLVDEALKGLSGDFQSIYADGTSYHSGKGKLAAVWDGLPI